MDDLGMLGFGRGGGCACKADWKTIEGLGSHPLFANSTTFQLGLNDAASSFSFGGERLVCSVDMIGPVSRGAYDFGTIAASHSLSDLFAVGAKPAFALAIAAWPREAETQLPEALDGIHSVLEQTQVQIVGGHTAHSEQPLLGVCAFGFRPDVSKRPIRAGDTLYLTKALGTGIVIGAIQDGACPAELERASLVSMSSLNALGLALGRHPSVSLVSDVTGFGLAGQAIRLARHSRLSVKIEGANLPAFPGVRELIRDGWGSPAAEINLLLMQELVAGKDRISLILAADPQTNGPLLVVADPSVEVEFGGLHRIGTLSEERDGALVRIV